MGFTSADSTNYGWRFLSWLAESVDAKPKNMEGLQRDDYIFIFKNSCVNGSAQFKSMLFKGQLKFVMVIFMC